MADNKTRPTATDVPTFLSGVADAGRRADAEALIAVMRDVTGDPPVMWGPSIIGFGSQHYRTDSGREGDSPIVAFSPRKAATVIYLSAGFAAPADLLARLGKHTTGKSCIYVKRLADVDLAVLRQLLDHAVAAARARLVRRAD